MKTKTKASGFFIVEILIVLLIVGILAIALLPNLSLYVQKAKFSDNISAAAALKPAVEMCLLKNLDDKTLCVSAAQGIPAAVTADYGGATGNVESANVTGEGVITVTSKAKFGPTGASEYTYILTPTVNALGDDGTSISWSDTDSTCLTPGLC